MHVPSQQIELIHIAETTSTNLAAKALPCETAKQHPIRVVWADYQQSGRGQKGTHWEAERDKNLLFTITVEPTAMLAKEQFILSEIASLSVCEALQDYANGFCIKWPNDVYHEEKKVCGMLLENKLEGTKVARSYLGIGVNVNQKVFTGNAPNPVSLCTITGKEENRETLLTNILERFEHYFLIMEKGEFRTIKEAYLSRLFRRNGTHTYHDRQGFFEAKILDVEPDGHLLMQDAEGQNRRYTFKEVKYVLKQRECE